jgi:nitroreductase
MPETLTVIKSRISANKFDTSRQLTTDEIRDLVAHASEAPSAYNIQPWRFIAVTEPVAKARLKAVSYNQQKVEDAAVTFIVLGDLRGYERLPEILQMSVAAGIIEPAVADGWVSMANAGYGGNEQLRRDEAIRSASLAAMNLMIAATARGLASGPMVGFDPAGVRKEFGISDRFLPVMLVTVGYPAPGNWPRKPRLAVDKVLAFNDDRPAWESED